MTATELTEPEALLTAQSLIDRRDAPPADVIEALDELHEIGSPRCEEAARVLARFYVVVEGGRRG